MLFKRDLSAAEHQQRVEAARSRWEKWAAGGAAAGLAAEAARVGGTRFLSRWAASSHMEEGQQAARRHQARAIQLSDKASKAGARMSRRFSAEWPVPAYGKWLGRQVRVRDGEERALAAGKPFSEVKHPDLVGHGAMPMVDYLEGYGARTGEMETLRQRIAKTPKPKKVEVVASRRGPQKAPTVRRPKRWFDPLTDPFTRASFEDEIAERVAQGVSPAEARDDILASREGRRAYSRRRIRGEAIEASPARGGEVVSHERRVKPTWPDEGTIDSWRAEARQDISRRTYALQDKAFAIGDRRAGAARAAAFGQARQLLRDMPRLRAGRLAAGAALGVGLGLGAAWAKEKLGKSTPDAIAAAAAATNPEPTPAQYKAGNYAKGRLHLHGLPISIETPAGGWRRGVGPGGKRWAAQLPGHYGYVRGTMGADGDQVDVTLGPAAHVRHLPVFAVDQIDPRTGAFDEHKFFLGYPTRAEALAAYDASFSDGSGPRRRKACTALTLDEFKAWLARGDVAPLAKAADDQPDLPGLEPEEDARSLGERALAQSIAALFQRFTRSPATAGDLEQTTEALNPVQRILEAAAAGAPPNEALTNSLLAQSPSPRVLAFDFDSRNPKVRDAIDGFKLKLAGRISQDTREAVRQALARGAEQGQPIEVQARAIREVVGLSPGQGRWVANFRQELERGDYAKAMARALRDRRYDRTLQRMQETGGTLKAEQIDAMVGAYHRRALAYRATSIARTEGLRAANFGQVTGMRAFLEAHPDLTVEKTWLATEDDKTREAHRELDGKTVVGLDTPFTYTGPKGTTATIRYPHDEDAPADAVVNCRCTTTFRVIRKPTAGRLIAEAV